MGGRLALVVVVVLSALLVLGCRGESESSEYRREVSAAFDDAAFADFTAYLIMTDPEVPQPLVPGERPEVLRKIRGWLEGGRLSGEQALTKHGRIEHLSGFRLIGPARELRLMVFQTSLCKEVAGGLTCKLNPRQVLVSTGGERFWRVHAPDMVEWLSTAYRTDVRFGTRAEREATLRALYPRPGLPTPADVSRVQLRPNAPGQPESLPIPLDGQAAGGQRVAKFVLDSLTEVVDVDQPIESVNAGYALDLLTGALGLVVGNAWICPMTSTGPDCHMSDDLVQVADSYGVRPPWIFRSLPLADWLREGWKADFRMGSPQEYQEALGRASP